MKTPRDLLLEKHRAATAALDLVRMKALETAVRDPHPAGPRRFTSRASRLPANFISKLGLELLWPCRRIWAGLAAVWVVILGVNASLSDKPRIVANNPPPSPEVLMALREQRRVLAELIQTTPVEAVEPPRRGPQPRSERRGVVEMA
jgi:hypothetical protein